MDELKIESFKNNDLESGTAGTVPHPSSRVGQRGTKRRKSKKNKEKNCPTFQNVPGQHPMSHRGCIYLYTPGMGQRENSASVPSSEKTGLKGANWIDFPAPPPVGTRLRYRRRKPVELKLIFVEPYVRASDGEASFVLWWRDQHELLWTSGLRSKAPGRYRQSKSRHSIPAEVSRMVAS